MLYVIFALAGIAVSALMLAVWIRHWWLYVERADQLAVGRFGEPPTDRE